MAKKKKASKASPKKPVIPRAIEKKPELTAEKENTKAMELEIMKLMEEELCPGISINIRFEMGVGRVKARLSREGKVIDTQLAEESMDISFDICCTGDIISLTGVCSAIAIITTDRKTSPLSDSDNPRKFEEQDILDILVVE